MHFPRSSAAIPCVLACAALLGACSPSSPGAAPDAARPAVAASSAAAPPPSATPSAITSTAPPAPSASAPDAGASNTLGADAAAAKLQANPRSLVGTMLTLRGRVSSSEGQAGYGMIHLVDESKPPTDYGLGTWLCRGIYSEEQSTVKDNTIVTVRGKVGKNPKYPMLEDCDVVK